MCTYSSYRLRLKQLLGAQLVSLTRRSEIAVLMTLLCLLFFLRAALETGLLRDSRDSALTQFACGSGGIFLKILQMSATGDINIYDRETSRKDILNMNGT